MKIEPVQKTIGVVRRKSSRFFGIGDGSEMPNNISPIGEYRTIGIVSSSEIQNLLRISFSISFAILGSVIARS
jgi:hypothetical protein